MAAMAPHLMFAASARSTPATGLSPASSSTSGESTTRRPSLRRFARSCALDVTPQLEALAGSPGVALDVVRVLAPIEPRQVLQAGANYYKHVLDLIVAERTRAGGRRSGDGPWGGRAIMDARVATASRICSSAPSERSAGPTTTSCCRARGEQHDWELELAAVLGPAGEIVGYTIANDLSTRDLIYRAGPEGDRHRLAAGQERADVPAHSGRGSCRRSSSTPRAFASRCS